MAFAKVFESIIGSTIWLEDDPTRIVWMTMLLRADRDGIVEGSIPGLAHLARVTPAQCAEALKKFLSPDEFSRTKDHEGRRIREVNGGWEILNHAMYRAKASPEEVRAKTAERQRLHRKRLSRKADEVTPCHATSHHVTQSNDIAESEAEVETEALIYKPSGNRASSPQKARRQQTAFISELQQRSFDEFWRFYWRKVSKKEARTAYIKTVKSVNTHSAVMAGLSAQSAAMILRDPENRPHAATWLSGARWEDVVEQPNPSRAKTTVVERAGELFEAMRRERDGN